MPLNLQTLNIIWPCALSIAFVGLLESLLTAKLVDELTVTPSSKRRESIGLGVGNIMAGLYGGIAGCAMIGQTIVNVEMGKGRSRISTIAAGIVLLLCNGAQRSDGQNPYGCAGGDYGDCCRQNLQLAQPSARHDKNAPIAETVVMLVTVAATVSTGNRRLACWAGLSSWH